MDYNKFDMKTPVSVGAGLGEMTPAKVQRKERHSTYNVMAINPGHNGSVALTIDGVLECYIEEERMSRNKYDGNPFRGMLHIMKDNHVDFLVICGTGQEDHSLPWTGETAYEALVRKFNPGLKVVKVGGEHHLGHAAATFYGSGFESAACIVVDGCGSRHTLKPKENEGHPDLSLQALETESIYLASYPGDFDPIFKRYGDNQVPRVCRSDFEVDSAVTTVKAYEAVSDYLGFGFIEAGKTMGLAPYGRKDDKIPDLFYTDTKRGDKNLFIAAYPRGSYIDTERYPYLAHSNGARNEWHGNPAKITDAQKNIAWKVQQETQEYVGDLIEKAVDMTGEDNICISGGYGLNVVANYYYKERFPELNIYVDPVSHDGGTAIGYARFFGLQNFAVEAKENGDEEVEYPMPERLDTLYLGAEYNYTIDVLKSHIDNDLIEVTDTTPTEVAQLIKDRKIVSIFQGRAEAGPRALGNRSILYDPTDPNGKDFVNRVKGREWIRPFAGSMLQEHAAEWFQMRGLDETPHMMYAMEMQDKHIGEIPAVTHVDGTCRIQTVTKEQNENYYNLINEFYKLSGVPLLFNTSFNLAGHPLVETMGDAIETLYTSQLEYMYLPELGKLVFLGNEKSIFLPSPQNV